MEKKYSASQLTDAAGISPMTYQQWRARGHIRRTARGTGNPQMYSFGEVLAVAVMARLVSLGVSIGTASRLVDPYGEDYAIAGLNPASLHGFIDSRAYLIVRPFPDRDRDGAKDMVEYTGPVTEIVREEDLHRAVTRYEGTVVISLDKIEQRVQRALEEGTES